MIDFVLYAGLIHFLVPMQWANWLSVSAGILNNYYLNARFNYQIKVSHKKALSCFYLVGMGGWAISAGLLFLLTEQLGFSAMSSKIVTIPLVVLAQFLTNHYWSFHSITSRNNEK